MFGFLKEKLKSTISKISKSIADEGEDLKEEAPKKEIETPAQEKVEVKVTKKEIIYEPVQKETKDDKKEQKEEKKGFFAKLKEKFTKKEEPKKEEELIEEIEISKKEEEIKTEDIEVIKEKEIPAPEKIYEEIKVNDSKIFYKKEREEQKTKEIKRLAEEKEKVQKQIKEKIQKKETPNLHELGKRREKEKEIRKLEEEKIEHIQKKEDEIELTPKITKREEPKEGILEEKKGFFAKIKEAVTTKKINESQFENIFWDLEVALLENNVAVEVIDKIKDDLKKQLVEKPLPRSDILPTITKTLKTSVRELFDVDNFEFLSRVKEKKPFVICFVGVNGSGKTTTIAKVANLLKNNGLSCVLAAADTFRAAAIQQLEEHGNNLGIKVIKHDYGSDAAAVAFDAVKYAEAKSLNAVLIDTAGRLHSNTNLMDELKKVIRVAKPDLVLFIGESITGNDCVEQAKQFNEITHIDGIILSKADIDEKGGAAISISYVTKKPILFIGVGQEYGDLKPFDPESIIETIGLET